MATLTITSSLSRVTPAAQLRFYLNAVLAAEFNYGVVPSPMIASPPRALAAVVSKSDYLQAIDALAEWSGALQRAFMLPEGGTPQPFVLTVAKAAAALDLTLTVGGATIHDGYALATDLVTVQPRASFAIGWADWLLFAGAHGRFAAELRRFT